MSEPLPHIVPNTTGGYTCSVCGKGVRRDATACKHCGAAFTGAMAAAPPKRGVSLRTVGLMAVGVVVVIAACMAFAEPSPRAPPAAVAPLALPATAAPTVDAVAATIEAGAAVAVPPTAAVAPTDVPPPPTTPTAGGAGVGEPREAGGVTLTVMAVSRATELSQFQTAEPGKEYVLAEVVLETTGRDTAPYNPFYFKVKDVDGYEYTVALNTGDNALKSGELAQGDKVRSVVAFEVPVGATGLILSYEPIVIAGGYDPIRIALD